MTPHISAPKGEIAKNVILPGDPIRAQKIAETILVDYKIVSEVRGNCIYTGKTADHLELSVMASGMGMVSTGIYSEELFKFYEIDRLIRVGTCGSYQKEVSVGNTIIPISCATDSNQNRMLFNGIDYAPTAGTKLLTRALLGYQNDPAVHFGIIHSSDFFYWDKNPHLAPLIKGGVLGVEMESSNIYTTAKRYQKEAISILLVSDSLVNEKEVSLSSKDRESTLSKNLEIALHLLTEK